MRGLSLVAASGGHSSSRCAGLSLSRPLLLRSTGSRRAGSVVVAHGPSCSAARGIFPDQGSNPCPLHWQEDSQPLRHQGSPRLTFCNCSGQKLRSHYYMIFGLHHTACGILVPRPGPQQWKRRLLTIGPPGNSLGIITDTRLFISPTSFIWPVSKSCEQFSQHTSRS